MLSPFSHFWLSAVSRAVARQAPLSMGYSRPEHWSGLPLPPQVVFFTTGTQLLLPENQCSAFADLGSHAQFPALSSPKPFLPTAWVQTLSQADLQLVHVGATRNPFPLSGCPFLLVSVYRAFAYASLVAQTVKASAYNVGDRVQSLDWEDPWRRKWQPTPVLLPGKSHGQRSLVGYSPWGRKESDTTERLHSLTHSLHTLAFFCRKTVPLKCCLPHKGSPAWQAWTSHMP